jgi:hypothetical protein
MNKSIFKSPVKTILLAGFIAGTLDILSAIIILGKGNWEGTLRFVASGALGNAAKEGGNGMLLYGLLFHYIIAFSFTIGFFIAARYFSFLQRNSVVIGLLYGIFVWAFMKYVALPFTHITVRPFSFAAEWKGMLILMLAIGLPISLITGKYYSNK